MSAAVSSPDPAALDLSDYGPWALIAGGSEGVGAEIAYLLAEAGISSLLVARRPEPLEATAAQVREYGVECRTVAVDLSSSEAVSAIASAAQGLDMGLLVLNAGANTHGGDFLDSDPSEVQKVIDLNITAPLALIREFGPELRARGKGGICVMGSMAGYLGHADMSIYSAAKAFSRIFIEGLWLELRSHGVDVCETILGVTRTPAMERAGLNFTVPGMCVSEPSDIAREVLGALGRGPIYICGGEANNQQVAWSSGTDRARIVAGADKRMRALRGR